MESEREKVEGELEVLLQLHSEVVRPVKCSGDDSPSLHSQDLSEELLLSSSSMLCIEILTTVACTASLRMYVHVHVRKSCCL